MASSSRKGIGHLSHLPGSKHLEWPDDDKERDGTEKKDKKWKEKQKKGGKDSRINYESQQLILFGEETNQSPRSDTISLNPRILR